MIEFILNSKNIKTDMPTGSILLDFIRNSEHLKGTKIGCREGDCGACTVLVGTLNADGELDYKTVVSCLAPIASVAGKHVVTIEGLNLNDGLTSVQDAVKSNNATQCGYCTPGFVVSFTGSALTKNTSIVSIKDAVSGNICRCTGYKSIENAANDINTLLAGMGNSDPIEWLINNRFIPDYFTEIPKRLKEIATQDNKASGNTIVGGGTDVYVQNADEHSTQDVDLAINVGAKSKLSILSNVCTIGVGATVTDILSFKEIHEYFPDLDSFFKLISSKQIRNMGTIAGNFVNASPIADLSIFFMSLNSRLSITDKNDAQRSIYLKDFFKNYKEVDLREGEILQELSFELPDMNTYVNFEKVSKRTHLDIASVNSAISITINNGVIEKIYISMGGVSAVPLFLKNTCGFLQGKQLTAENIRKAHCVLKEEISPISDIRGSEEYKRLLGRQLYYAHFMKLFPDVITLADIKK